MESSRKGTLTPPVQEVMKYVNVTKTLNFRVKSLDNIDDAKDKLSELEDIETNLQKVFFTEKNFVNDQELDYQRKDGYSHVHMNLNLGVRMQVKVKVSWGTTTTTTTAKLISLDVHSWNTISDLKTKFQEKEGTPANQLTLIYEKRQLDDDLQTLAGYDIKNDSIIHAVFVGEDKIKITVSTPIGFRVEVRVKHCWTVENLKRIIHCMEEFAVDRQKLTFNGLALENSLRLADYKIQMGSLIELDSISGTSGFKIFVKTQAGKTLTIYVNSSDTVYTLKTKVRSIYRGILEEHQNFSFDGNILENDRLLSDYDIQKGSTLHLHVYVFM